MAELSFRVSSDTKPLEKSLIRADRTIREAVRRSNREFQKLQREVDQSNRAMSRFSAGSRAALGNVAQQVQDVAVQFQAGTNSAVIFAQQGPQIASAFGPVGAVLGGIGAVAVVAGTSLLGMGENAAKAAESLGGLLDSSLDDATASAKRFADEIRKADQAQKDFASSLASLQTVELKNEAFGLLSGLGLDRQIAADPRVKQIRQSVPQPAAEIAGQAIRIRRDLTAPIKAAITAGKPNEVLRLAKEAGLFTAENSAAVQRLVEIAQRVQLNKLIEGSDSAGLGRLAGESPPIPVPRPVAVPSARPDNFAGASFSLPKPPVIPKANPVQAAAKANNDLLQNLKKRTAETAALAKATQLGADALFEFNTELEVKNTLEMRGLQQSDAIGESIAEEIRQRREHEKSIAGINEENEKLLKTQQQLEQAATPPWDLSEADRTDILADFA